jgi:hypothetical protein
MMSVCKVTNMDHIKNEGFKLILKNINISRIIQVKAL